MTKLFIPDKNSIVFKQISNKFEVLLNELDKHLKQKNIILIDDFYKFEPLYNNELKNNLSNDELNDLGNEFYNTIDPYQPIKIIDSNNNILFTLPAIFVPLNQIKTNDKNKNILETFKTKNDDSITSSDLTNIYAIEFFKTQLSDDHKKILKNYRKKYIECIKSLKKEDKNEIQEKNLQTERFEDTENIKWE